MPLSLPFSLCLYVYRILANTMEHDIERHVQIGLLKAVVNPSHHSAQ